MTAGHTNHLFYGNWSQRPTSHLAIPTTSFTGTEVSILPAIKTEEFTGGQRIKLTTANRSYIRNLLSHFTSTNCTCSQWLKSLNVGLAPGLLATRSCQGWMPSDFTSINLHSITGGSTTSSRIHRISRWLFYQVAHLWQSHQFMHVHNDFSQITCGKQRKSSGRSRKGELSQPRGLPLHNDTYCIPSGNWRPYWDFCCNDGRLMPCTTTHTGFRH